LWMAYIWDSLPICSRSIWKCFRSGSRMNKEVEVRKELSL
jgi:hypothetical protein